MHIRPFIDPTPAPTSPTDVALVHATWWLVGATIAVAAAAVVGLFLTYRAFRAQVKDSADRAAREAQEREDALAGQARLILSTVRGDVHEDHELATMGCKVFNNSDRNMLLEMVRFGDLATGAERNFYLGYPIAAGDNYEETAEIALWALKRYTSEPATILYLDAAGLRWERVGMGEPRRILDRDAYFEERQAAWDAHWGGADETAADYAATT